MAKRDLTHERLIEFENERDYREERYNVTVETHYDEVLGAEGIMETWSNQDGKTDRRFGPAMLHISTDNEKIIYEAWYRNGDLHREDGPALIYRDPKTDHVIREEFYLNGIQFVPSDPAGANPTP